MPTIHPRPDLARELATRISEEERKLLRHAVECPTCRGLFLGFVESCVETGEAPETRGRILPWPVRGAREHDYTAAIDCVLARTPGRFASIRREQAEAPARVAEILRQPPSRRGVLVENSERFWSLAVVDQLLRASREEASGSPEAGEGIALLAVEVLEHLEVEEVGALLLADARARCQLAIGNARRIACDLCGAEEAFTRADEYLRQGTRDRLERARLHQYRASLRLAQRRFDEATRLLDRAIGTYRRAGERQWAGEAIVARAFAEKEIGFPERAIELLREAIRWIEPAADPRLALCVHHNLIDWLTDAGRALEAQRLMARSADVYRRFDDPPTVLRRLWVQGKIARGLGQLEESARLFSRVREGWIELGIGYEAAVASLDLASVAAQLGRTVEVQRLAEEMLPIFRSRDIRREAIAALIMFQGAAADERATRSLVEALSSYLRRSAGEVGLPFEPRR